MTGTYPPAGQPDQQLGPAAAAGAVGVGQHRTPDQRRVGGDRGGGGRDPLRGVPAPGTACHAGPGGRGQPLADPHPVLGGIGPALLQRRIGCARGDPAAAGSWSRWTRRRQREVAAASRATPCSRGAFSVVVTGQRVMTGTDSSGPRTRPTPSG